MLLRVCMTNLALPVRGASGYKTFPPPALLTSFSGHSTTVLTACICHPPPSSCCFREHMSTAPKTQTQSRHTLSPAVRFLVDSNNVDLTAVTGSGPQNRVLKGDVLRYLENLRKGRDKPVSAPSKPVSAPRKVVKQVSKTSTYKYTDVPVDGMRRTIAERTLKSKTSIPCGYTSTNCNLKKFLHLKKSLKEQGMAVTTNDLLVRAAALTLQRFPESNALWTERGVVVLPSVDISVAVATRGGVLSPVVRGANKLSLKQLSTSIHDLVHRATGGHLKASENQGGAFSLSNLGMFGVSEFSAIIKDGQSSILSVGTIQLVPKGDVGDKEGCVAHEARVTLVHDLRVLDYELACRWLEHFRACVETGGIL